MATEGLSHDALDSGTLRAGSFDAGQHSAGRFVRCVLRAGPHYIARTAHDLGDARDLTQEFFTRLLSGQVITSAERAKGRFRGYLLVP
jgi:hypothetical protein